MAENVDVEMKEEEGEGLFDQEMEIPVEAPPKPPEEEEIDWNEPVSPIRTPWPSDSLLKPDHFTIDEQHCLNCGKKLGYAMPMNRIPKSKYLFCPEPSVCSQVVVIKCWVCGNFNNENSGHVVHRPGNSSYQGPSQIYSFMCHHCYKDQMEMEPGLEETKEMMDKFRDLRRADEQTESYRRISSLAASGTYGASAPPTAFASSISQILPRKRIRDASEGPSHSGGFETEERV